jgi:7-cyano-7-deazaguanine synthase
MNAASEGIAVLASGGVDSAVLLHEIADRGKIVHPVFVRQGFRWERMEHLWLRRFLAQTSRPEFRDLTVLVLPLADLYPADHFAVAGAVPAAGTPDEDCYLPGRNLTMLAKAAIFAALNDLSALALGSLGGNPFPDATPGFFAEMASTATRGLDHPLEILAPFGGLTKEEVLRKGAGLPLQLTLSCMEPAGELNCGRCSKCHERRQAFRSADLVDPTIYGDTAGPAPLEP